MKIIIHSLLVLLFTLSISCSSGGTGDQVTQKKTPGNEQSKPAPEIEYKNVPNSVLGKWDNGNGIQIFIAEKSLKIFHKCSEDDAEFEIGIELTDKEIIFTEAKMNCGFERKIGDKMQFLVMEDELLLTVEKQQLGFKRILDVEPNPEPSPSNPSPSPSHPGNTPTNPKPPANNPGNSPAQSPSTLLLYTGVDCQGEEFTYSKNMNCATLTNAALILSVNIDGQCVNEQATSAEYICEVLNQQP